MSQNLLENLNPEQYQAVVHREGPLMIIAGAGTGKTTVITHRIAWLIEQALAKPDEVLALTFTDKAANEMEERVDLLLPIGYVDLWISTFHSFAEKILREHGPDIGLPANCSLLNGVDTLLLIRRNFDRFNFNYYAQRGNPTRFINDLIGHFSRAKDELITPEAYIAYATKLAENAKEEADKAEAERILELANAYKTYQQLLVDNHAYDFGDLVYYTVELLQKRPNVLKKYQEQFKYILVDEFQDTNKGQYELVKLLAGKRKNVTIVGDDDQAIYHFRGASLGNILQFKTDFEGATAVVLNRNYRSHSEVLDTAYNFIQANNPHRLEIQQSIDKRLHSEKGTGGFVRGIKFATEDDEVDFIVKTIVDLVSAEEADYRDIAVLSRSHSSASGVVSRFEALRVPYRYLAQDGLYLKPLIVDALAYLRAVDQSQDDTSYYRIFSHPELGIDARDLHEITMFAKKKGLPLVKAMKLVGSIQGISESSLLRIREIEAGIERLHELAKRKNVSALFIDIINESGLLTLATGKGDEEQKEAIGLLNQFHARLKKFEETSDDGLLHTFLAEFVHEREAGETGMLQADIESGPDVVSVMTVHSSKGLEFKYVFIISLVDQRFPSRAKADALPLPSGLNVDPYEEANNQTSEERRLFYVALTRAKIGAYLLASESYGGARKKKPSKFFEEMKMELETSMSLNAFEERESPPVAKHELKGTEIKSVSITSLKDFSDCPLKYRYRHILRIPIYGTHNQSFGTTMHNTVQRYFESAKDTTLPAYDDLLRIYDEQFIDEWYPDEAKKEEFREKGRVMLKDFHEKCQEQSERVFYLEQPFSFKFGTVKIAGRIDRIDSFEDGVEIIDYKTGKPKEKLEPEDKKQLLLYKYAANACFNPPLNVKKLTYYYLENGTRVSFTATEKDMVKFEEGTKEAIEDLLASNFKATPSAFTCGSCPFKDICEFSEA